MLWDQKFQNRDQNFEIDTKIWQMVRIGTGPFNRDRCGHTANHWLQIYNFIQNLAYNLQAYINKYLHLFFYKAKTNLSS